MKRHVWATIQPDNEGGVRYAIFDNDGCAWDMPSLEAAGTWGFSFVRPKTAQGWVRAFRRHVGLPRSIEHAGLTWSDAVVSPAQYGDEHINADNVHRGVTLRWEIP